MVREPGVESLRAIRDVDHLEDLLSEPTEGVVETLRRLDGDLLILGASGKMGPTLARMARRALDAAGSTREVIAVARFSDLGAEDRLREFGIRTIRCDLLDDEQLARLPDSPNVMVMTGMKFGTSGREGLTWAINTFLPGLICRRFRRSRIVAFSTGNVYGPTPVSRGGSREEDPLEPRGEYAMSCVGRERIFAHFGQSLGIPTALIRLNYAVEMRYGVLVDIARKVLAREPIDLSVGYANVIWQADANAIALRIFADVDVPTAVFNLTGPEVLRVRDVAERFGTILEVPVTFVGSEADEALLSDGSRTLARFGGPRVGPDRLIELTAEWLLKGGPTLDKPTRFESADGRF